MKTLNRVIYCVFGAVALLYGAIALVSPGQLESEARHSLELAHLMRELGAAGVFIGLTAFWCAVNYERSRSVHCLLMVFTFLLAAIHWFEYLTGNRELMSPLVNSVPFAVLLIIAVVRRGRHAGLH